MARRLCTLGDLTTGQGTYPPQTTFKTTAPLVDIEGVPVLTVADGITPFVNSVTPFDVHPARAATGSILVDIEGIPVLREGDIVAPLGSNMLSNSNFLVYEE